MKVELGHCFLNTFPLFTLFPLSENLHNWITPVWTYSCTPRWHKTPWGKTGAWSSKTMAWKRKMDRDKGTSSKSPWTNYWPPARALGIYKKSRTELLNLLDSQYLLPLILLHLILFLPVGAFLMLVRLLTLALMQLFPPLHSYTPRVWKHCIWIPLTFPVSELLFKPWSFSSCYYCLLVYCISYWKHCLFIVFDPTHACSQSLSTFLNTSAELFLLCFGFFPPDTSSQCM